MRALVLVLLLGTTAAHAQSPAEDAEPQAENEADTDEADTDEADTDEADTDEADTAEAAAEAAAEAEAEADTETEVVPSALRPKVALLVLGDADAFLLDAARRLEGALREVDLPSDALVRAALRGEAGDDSDGLQSVRGRRRAAALDPSPRELAWVADLTGADVVVLIRRSGREAILRVLDAGAGAFFDERPSLEPLTRSARFVTACAQAAQDRSSSDAEPDRSLDPSRVAASADSVEDDEEDEELPPARAFFKKNWAYFVAGALLVGIVTFFVLRDRDDGVPPPVLRFGNGP